MQRTNPSDNVTLTTQQLPISRLLSCPVQRLLFSNAALARDCTIPCSSFLLYNQLQQRSVVPDLTASFKTSPASHSLSQRQAVAHTPFETKPLKEVIANAGKKALGGGLPGMAAMVVQVLSLMWLRTTINYQYRYGTGTLVAMRTLYQEGGVRRFYRGVGPALIQAPLSRFGDTAANAGTLTLLNGHEATSKLPVAVKTAAASVAAASFRILLMPVDSLKTVMQVEGAKGFPLLAAKVQNGGPRVLFHGSLAAAAATFAGHYPWFLVYNSLNKALPDYDDMARRLLRAAVIGFCSSAVSDTVSNSLRVVKTTKQTAPAAVTYPQAVRMVVEKDGVVGLFGRGLKTKIIGNGIQGIMFTVLWRLGQDWWGATPVKA